MNELDQYIKRDLKISYYTRYMDDFIILAKTKKECISIKYKVEKFLSENLQLRLNNKSRYYPYSMGVNFCGYRIFTTHRLLRVNSKKKIKRKIRAWNALYSKNKLDIANTMLSINSWLGHSSHCNSYTLQKEVLNKCSFLYTNQTSKDTEKHLIELIENEEKKV